MLSYICLALIQLSMPNAHYACKNLKHIQRYSKQYNIKPSIVISLIHRESRWKLHAKSKAGACGLTQIIPKYWSAYKLTCRTLRHNARISIKYGIKILKVLYKTKYAHKNYRLALCMYNAGWRCKGKYKLKRSIAYANKILRFAQRIDETAKQLKSIATRNKAQKSCYWEKIASASLRVFK